MTLYLDNDALFRLAAYDLADVFLDAMGVEDSEIRVLPTARWVGLKNAAQAARRVGDHAVPRLRALLDRFPALASVPDLDLVFELAGVTGVDVGELQLFVAAMNDTDSIVVTGDVTALTALARDSRCARVAAALAGRVVCWEQVLAVAQGALAFEDLKERIVPHRELDGATKAIFGSGAQATPEAVTAAIAGYVADRRSVSGDLLAASLPRPPG